MTSEQSYLHSMVIIDAPWIVPQGISSLLSCKVKNYDRIVFYKICYSVTLASSYENKQPFQRLRPVYVHVWLK